MAIAYIALGSNLGDRRGFLDAAVRRLRAEPSLRLLAVSSYYETAPVGGPAGQGGYLNAAAKIDSSLSPHQLMRFCQQIEKQQGRVRSVKDGPRTLDLDLLLYNDLILNEADLILPHPRMHERAFVLIPLNEIAGDAVHPIIKQKISDLVGRTETLRDPTWPVKTSVLVARFPRFELQGLRALITGSSSGIGKAIAEAFFWQGTSVMHHNRRVADLRDPIQNDDLAESAWGDGLDILVCNAGADTLTGELAKASFDEKLEALLAVDLKGTMRLARNLGARMKARGRGVIITIGWDQAETGMEGDSGQLFAAVKGAVMSFTQSLALSLAPEVRVNCIAPGWIRTAWGETASEVWQERVRRETPLGLWGLPEDVANAAVWLASPAASFITGQTIRVNGGAV